MLVTVTPGSDLLGAAGSFATSKPAARCARRRDAAGSRRDRPPLVAPLAQRRRGGAAQLDRHAFVRQKFRSGLFDRRDFPNPPSPEADSRLPR
jgi:hypothetical protein